MSYSTCNYTTEIDENECIGDSLTTINANFSALEVAVCDLTNYLTNSQITINDSPTIDLTLTTNRLLSADVKQNSIRYSNLASWQTLSASPTLSADAVTQRMAKAWVYFNAQPTVPDINSSFNVTSIQKLATGAFYINLVPGTFSSLNYVLVGSTMQGYAAPPNTFTYAGITDNANLAQDTISLRPDTLTRIYCDTHYGENERFNNTYNFVVIFGN